jgi:hypothetical protein
MGERDEMADSGFSVVAVISGEIVMPKSFFLPQRLWTLVLAVFASGAVGACLQPFAHRCDLQTAAGACLSITKVAAYYPAGGGYTSNVDAEQGTCEIPDPTNAGSTKLVAEPFTDHNVVISVLNEPPPLNADRPELAPAVIFDTFSATYVLNECPAATECPPLDPMDGMSGPSFTIKGGEEVDVTFPLVPLRKKIEFADAVDLASGGAPMRNYPSYSAQMFLRGHDADAGPSAGFTIEMQSAVEFTIGNYDNCPSPF